MNSKINKIVNLCLTLGILTFSGCALFKDKTGAIDIVKVEKVKAAIEPVVTVVIARVVKKNKDTALYFSVVSDVFCKIKETKEFAPEFVIDALNKATENLIINQDVNDAKTLIISLYKITAADKGRSNVSEDVFLTSLVDVLCNSIREGVKQGTSN